MCTALSLCVPFDMHLQIPELRKVSRWKYLDKRKGEKVVELKDDLADEDFLFSESRSVSLCLWVV